MMCFVRGRRWSRLATPCAFSSPWGYESYSQVIKLTCGSRYGSSCNLVLSTGQGVHGFTLDEVRRSPTHAESHHTEACLVSLGPRRVHPHSPRHHHPQTRQDLLLQRGEQHALLPTFPVIPGIDQVPEEWQALLGEIHRVYGRGCASDVAVWRDLRVSR